MIKFLFKFQRIYGNGFQTWLLGKFGRRPLKILYLSNDKDGTTLILPAFFTTIQKM